MRLRTASLTFLCIGTPAAAEVVSAGPNGFEVRQEVNLVVPAAAAFAALGAVDSWWDKDHTYSGRSANMRLSLTPGGCLCERFPDGGGVEHMRVTFVEPGKRLVLTGALGPLLYEGTAGVMDIEIKPRGGGSQLVMTYRVAGFARGGGDKSAGAVDGVLARQWKNYRQYVTRQPRT